MMPTRTSLKKNLMAACSIGVMAVAITGCSSSDKDSVSPALQRQVSAAKAAQSAAEAERDKAATAAEMAATEAATAAEMAATALEAAQAALTAATDAASAAAMAAAATITDLEAERDAAQSAVTAIETALNAALEDAGVEPGADMVASIEALAAALTEAKADLALVEQEVAEAKAKAAGEERVARAGGFDDALRLGDPPGTSTTALGGTVPENFMVKRSDNGRTVTVEVEDSDYDAVTGTPDEHGWTTVTLVDEGNNSTETLVVYTNIDTPTDESLIKEEGGVSGQFLVWYEARDDKPRVDKLGKAHPLPSIVSNLRSAAALLGDDMTTLQVGAEKKSTVGSVTTMTRTFDGTYDDVRGTFVCASLSDQPPLTGPV